MLWVDLDGNAKFTKFGASKSQKVSEHFSIEHFAGPAVYTTEYFIEKNRDSLPQGTAALLKHSNNHIVASSSAVVGTYSTYSKYCEQHFVLQLIVIIRYVITQWSFHWLLLLLLLYSSSSLIIWVDEASAIIDAAAAIAGDASNPSASLSAPSGKFAGGRRVSVMGNAKTPPSMVAQLKNELAVMMAHINTTVRRDEHNRW